MNSKFKFPKTISSCCATKIRTAFRTIIIISGYCMLLVVWPAVLYIHCFAGKNKFDHLPPTVLYISMYLFRYNMEFINGSVQIIAVVQRIKSIRIRWDSYYSEILTVASRWVYYKFANMLSSVRLWMVCWLPVRLVWFIIHMTW